MLREPRLLKDGVGRVPGFYPAIDREADACVWREPNVVVTFTGPLESTSGFLQQTSQLWGEVTTHQAAALCAIKNLRANNSKGTSGPSG